MGVLMTQKVTHLKETEESKVTPEDVDSEEDVVVPPSSEHYHSNIYNGFSQQPVDFSDRVKELEDYQLSDFNGDDDIVLWNENTKEIHLGMLFESKDDVMSAVRRWNVEKHRELYVSDSKPTFWKAKCRTLKPNKDGTPIQPPPTCRWAVTASKRQNNNLWRINVWTPAHSCYSTVEHNNNCSLRSKDVASYILSQIRADVTYKAKQIQSYIKEKKAIESIYGSWESNFEELPKYIAALQLANPGTIVQWLHHPHGSSECAVFKYVFLAFGETIKAFHYCQLVISVDGTRLKGSYRGKLLIAVTKNANNYILPLAYAIVDEERNESWTCFFRQLREHIVNENMGGLCVISDRHKGIIKAMETLDDWKEPNAYHRYCLRHIRSNFAQNSKAQP
ncbi:uncharacterized protein LOC143536797 [Bidens hawaiensis]|uniref:uncharacterized protein LOC143536797 n=1 Tax=Bidens hawaiensis TaxID=980011 RepID=UPI004048FF3B